MVMSLMLTAMPLFLLFGVFLLISFFAYILNFADTITYILTIRLVIFAINTFCIMSLLCWNGQQLIDVTSNIFFTLAAAPWYYWNLENIKILLMFITNCTKNESIICVGICLDCTMFVSMIRIAVSYALVLTNLRKNSLF
ncbi:uncharacterized protein LOC123011939 [Tribolium madens]|uniref:uncharacterized protein LOC123011939 n=1 Tax=Tribolium madens TaxID=41895 RepID=UPI001CF73E6D|nr:uncharacterized protein LOC123011939 [Tribolium madens]